MQITSPTDFAKIADLLLAARRDGRALPPLSAAERPKTLAEGYAIQALVSKAMGEPVTGWKIGATAKLVQEKFGTDRPFIGPLFATTTYPSGAEIPADKLQHKKIECEFAFRLNHPLHVRAEPYTQAEIVTACDALIPTIEVVSPRFAAIPFGEAPTAIADWGVNGAIVLGKPITNAWKDVDLALHRVQLTVDDALVAEGTGAAVLGNPLVSLTWAVEDLRQRGMSLAAGTLISTGSMTGMTDVALNQPVIANFGSFGLVEMTFV
ncbi:MAG: fumarylacetoacetate hydrolase family protein [Hyphomicrobiaceae bacterium]